MKLREQTRQIGQPGPIRPSSGVRRAAGATLLLAALAMQGCSSWPNWANPGKWYDGVFGDEPTTSSSTASDQMPAPTEATGQPAGQSPGASQGGASQGGAQKGFPNLATVPPRPPESSSGERRAMQQSLAADRDSAHYTDEDLRGQPATAAPTPPTVPNTATAGTAPSNPATPGAAPSAPAVATPPPPPAASTASAQPAAPTAGTAPLPAVRQAALAPPPAVPKPATPSAPAPAVSRPAAPSASTPAPPPTAAAIEPQPPANLGTSVADVYRQALQQSAATVTTAPADPHFVPPRGQPVQQFSTAVPPIVQQNYNSSLAVRPPALSGNGAPATRRGTGGTAFATAGSHLAAMIQFADGSASLSAEDRVTIRNILATYKQSGGIIRIVGYASGQGGAESVQQKLAVFDIADRRAEAVANELIRQGARPNSVFVEAQTGDNAGYGAVDGVAREDLRRAEIFLEN
ncbi:MAG TPA: OmpA family protein [Candidatus Sulfotelmatobacter sp.]|nr:OmpA family protein [Candidatus Sulfotelmatobacter sp.]